MNDFELSRELEANEAEKNILKEELEASKRKYAEYMRKNMETGLIDSAPVRVRKKKSALLSEFYGKIRKIMGFGRRKEGYDGIEAYLQLGDED